MNSEASSDNDKNEWLINDEGGDASKDTNPDDKSWRILIVDDDVDVHVVTKFSLRNVTYMGRTLSFLHAYSGKEAISIMRETRDIALVLLDVVMETNEAGLQVAREIRGELDNHMVRVVLRTGQSGQAMEQNVIVDYDINDYRTKGDLTTQKLFTTVIASLRSYDSMVKTARSQEALAASIAKVKDLQTALDQHAMLSIADANGNIIHANDKLCAISKYGIAELLARDHRMLYADQHPKEFVAAIWDRLGKGLTWQGELKNRAKDGSYFWVAATLVPFMNASGKPYQFVAVLTEITERRQEGGAGGGGTGMRLVLESSPSAVSAMRLSDSRLMYSNRRFAELFQLSAAQAQDVETLLLYQNPLEYREVRERVIQGEAITNRRIGLQTLDGQKVPVVASFSLTEFEGEPAILSWFFDPANVQA